MTKLVNRFILFRILKNSVKSVSNRLASLVFAAAILGSTPTIANAELAQVTLTIDATFTPTFSDLVDQAESLAQIAIAQQFQADPTLSELQITVLGERNGQIVSLLSSRMSRDEWQGSSDIRQQVQYFATSSALLGYRNSSPVSTRETIISSASSTGQDPSQTLEQARSSKRISEQEYWQLVDALD